MKIKNARWAIFLSGRGSTAQAVLDLFDEIHLVSVLSNKREALGLKRARRMGVLAEYREWPWDWEKIHQDLTQKKVTHIFLLGFMKLLPEHFIQQWDHKIINVHPSLLPKFPGLHAIEKSFESGEEMGVTIHEVISEMDAGPMIVQRKVMESGHRLKNTLQSAQLKIAICEQDLIRRSILKRNYEFYN